MSVLAVLPARLGATRLPRKPLRLLGGIPLIVRVAERVRSLNVAATVVVATDSDDVASVCRHAGITVALTRADHPSGTDRVAEVAARDEFAEHSVIVNVQGDEPFVSAAAVRGAVEQVSSGRFPLGTAATVAGRAALDDPDTVKVVTANDGRALYFSRAPIPFLRDAADRAHQEGMLRRHLGVYAYTRLALAEWVRLAPHPLELCERLEQLRPLAHGMAMGVATVVDAAGMGIDTEADLAAAEQYLSSSPQSSLS